MTERLLTARKLPIPDNAGNIIGVAVAENAEDVYSSLPTILRRRSSADEPELQRKREPEAHRLRERSATVGTGSLLAN